MFVVFLLLDSVQLLGGGARVAADALDRHVAYPPLHVLIVSIPDRKLALTQDGRVLRVYSVAVGAAVSPSPTGTLKIINKVPNPTYYHRGTVIAPGKSNPLGNRWIGLDAKGYGIHGTNVPSSIGKAASHGCIRLGKQDVEDLFNRVQVGDVVEIHGQRDQQVAQVFAHGRWPLA
jgi:lipoprotein-anchoring transpeptidase ErfK/SrfK